MELAAKEVMHEYVGQERVLREIAAEFGQQMRRYAEDEDANKASLLAGEEPVPLGASTQPQRLLHAWPCMPPAPPCCPPSPPAAGGRAGESAHSRVRSRFHPPASS